MNNNQMNENQNNDGMLAYSRNKISQIAQCLSNINLSGVTNIKNLSVVFALLEMPDKVIEAEKTLSEEVNNKE